MATANNNNFRFVGLSSFIINKLFYCFVRLCNAKLNKYLVIVCGVCGVRVKMSNAFTIINRIISYSHRVASMWFSNQQAAIFRDRFITCFHTI